MPTLAERGVVTVTIDGRTLYHRIHGQPPTGADGVEWVIEEITGWGGPGVRTSRTARPLGQHGSFRAHQDRTERIIGMKFAVSVPYGDVELGPMVQRQVSALCTDPDRLYVLTVDDPWLGPLSADVELDDEILSEWVSPFTNRYSAQFAAPDPRLHGAWVVRETPLPTYVEGGADATTGLNATAPGLSAGGIANPGLVRVPNDGTADTSPVLEIVGPATTPQVVVQETGQTLDVSLNLTAGQNLWINADTFPALGIPARGVLLDGTSTRRRHLTIPGGWPVIRKGQSVTFAFRAASYAAGTLLRVHARDAWW